MRLVCLATVLLLTSCATVGTRRVGPAPTGDHASRPVILVVVEGLRADVFNRYLETIRDAENDPHWRSGLALLAREKFQLVAARRAEAPVPAVSMASLATIMTGQQPGESGVPGTAYHAQHPTGELISYDFSMANHASQIFFARDLKPLENAGQSLANLQLDGKTLFERLGPERRAVAINMPLALGSDWRVPQGARLGTDAMLPHDVGAAAVPLFDGAGQEAAVDALLAEPLPHLLALYFRQVVARSCQQSDQQCSGQMGDLITVQTEALKVVDAKLWRILSKMAVMHPGKFSRAQVILTSTGGMVDRTIQERVDEEQVINPHDLLTRLAVGEDAACEGALTGAWARGELAVAPNAGAALVTLTPRPAGERFVGDRIRACLAAAIERVVRAGEWAAAGGWRTTTGSDGLINPRFEQTLPSHRRPRALGKLRALASEHPHAPDGVIIGQSGWIFIGDARPKLLPAAGRGGLGDDVMRIPFLVASRSFSPNAAASLRGAPVELADVAPTVLSLLRVPETEWSDLPREPLLRWRDDSEVLDLERADRQIAVEADASPYASWVWKAEGQNVVFGIRESVSVWPPRELVLRFGEDRFVYDATAEKFPEGSPCVYERTEETRSWKCTVPRPTKAGVSLAAGRRTPAGDESDEEDERTASFLEPTVWGNTTPLFTKTALRCAQAGSVRARIDAADDAGLRSVSVYVVDADGGGRRVMNGGGFVTQSLLGQSGQAVGEASAACADPTSADCTPPAAEHLIGKDIELEFPSDRLEHAVVTTRQFTAHRQDTKGLRQAFTDGGGTGTAPEFAYVGIQVCNMAGRCVRRALVSDVDYRRALGVGCP